MALIITIVAVVNLAAGFGLAVYLGMGSSVPSPTVPGRSPQTVDAARKAAPVAPSPAPPAAAAPAPPAPPPPAPAPPAAAPAAPSTPPPPAAGPAETEATIDEVKNELVKYREQLAQLGKQIRQCAASPEASAAKQCVAGLTVANTQYVERQTDAAGRLAELAAQANAETAAVGARLVQAVTEQTEQVRAATEKLAQLDLQRDLAAGCQSLACESAALAESNYTLSDSLEEARLELAPAGGPDAAPERGTGCQLIGRARWEAIVGKRLKADADRTAAITVAIVDVDDMRAFNEQNGEELGDRLLAAIAKAATEDVRGDDVAGRHSGQRFLLLMPHTTTRDGTTALERLRQRIECTQYRKDQQVLRATVSCAVAEAMPGDSVAALLERAEATLQAAKQFGRNRTFMYEGRQPAPVVPPTLNLEPQVVLL